MRHLSTFPGTASTTASTRPLRVAYMAGPGNVAGVLRCLARGERDTSNSHVGYSELMIRACQRAGVAELLCLSTHPEAKGAESFLLRGLRVTVQHVADPYAGKRRLGFHLASIDHAKQLRSIVKAFKADVLVVGDDPPRAIALSLIPPGCKLVRVHHCAITPIRQRQSFAKAALVGLDCFADGVFDAIVTASRALSEQAATLMPGTPIVEFLPHFDEGLHKRFSPLPAFGEWVPLPNGELAAFNAHRLVRELRCVFVGRIERNKGVFDLLEAAQLCAQAGARVSFDICGDGSALDELRAAALRAEEWGVDFRLHGRCNREQMQAIIARAHIGVVPTRSEFPEGFAQVVCEHLLSGRPVVATDAVPGAPYASEAVSVVRCDDPMGLALELTYLASERGFHRVQEMAAACEREAAKFFDEATNFDAAMESVLGSIARGEKVVSRLVGFDGAVSQ